MKRFILLLFTLHCSLLTLFSQAPQKFNYQAVVRNDGGEIVADQSVGIRITILQGAVDGTVVYSETHTPTTNAYGLVTLSIGGGTTSDDFSLIDWGADLYFMKVEMDAAGGTAYSEMGTTQLLSVPYALFASAVDTPLTKLGIMEDALANPEDALFEVKRKDGQTVFAVYNEGIRAYIDDSDTKGPKGGFAIGGIRPGKGVTNEFFRVSPDSVRIYVNEPAGKGTKGGFAVGGIKPAKSLPLKYLQLTPENYFIGHEAGSSNTTGLYNSFFGYQAGYSNTTGNNNLFFGIGTGYSNVDGSNNIFIGDFAGNQNTSGEFNVFIGDNAGKNNLTGWLNIAIGNFAGHENTTGEANIFVGVDAGRANTEGKCNIFMGHGTGLQNTTGDNNIFLGDFSGYSNDTAYSNIFIGNLSGYSNTGGHDNVLVGNSSGHQNVNGFGNTMIGSWAGYTNTTGYNNTFLGVYCGNGNISGIHNVFLGHNVGGFNDAGSFNVYVGSDAGLQANGSYNIFLGNTAGYYEQGSNKLYIENSEADSTEALIYGEFDNDFLRLNADVFINGNLNLSSMDNTNLFLGDSTGFFNSSGGANTIVGHEAGIYNSSGGSNAFFGTYSGNKNTTGDANVFVGLGAGANNKTGSYNVYIGKNAGNGTTNGYLNVFIGNEAGHNEQGSNKLYIENSGNDSNDALIYGEFDNDLLRFNAEVTITGRLNLSDGDNSNMFLGDSTGFFNSSGWANTFIGHEAGIYNTAGQNNTSLGFEAGYANHGDNNVFIGGYAAKFNFTGSSNTIVGLGAGYNSKGSGNVFIGRDAGYHDQGSNKLYIENCGSDSNDALIYGEFDNDWVRINDSLGIGRDPEANHLEVEGTASKTTAGDWLANSDIRIKTDIQDIENATETLLQLRPVAFRYSEEWKGKHPGIKDRTYYNFVAQEYQEVFPEAVQGSGEYLGEDPDEMLQIDTYPAQVITMKAVQELILQNQEQQKMIEELKEEIEKLKKK